MKFEELLQKAEKKGFEQGFKKGIEQGLAIEETRILKLANSMIKAGQAEELPRLEQDSAFLEEMFEKYQL